MLVLLSDTHRDSDPGLSDYLAETLQEAETVVHAGDFTTDAVLERFDELAKRFVAVAGNSDSEALQKRLPEWLTVEFAGRQFVVTHGHRRDRTALSLLARQEGADVAVVGHTHRAGIDHVGECAVVNPGSHTDPRGEVSTFAVVTRTGDGLRVQHRTTAGQTVAETVL